MRLPLDGPVICAVKRSIGGQPSGFLVRIVAVRLALWLELPLTEIRLAASPLREPATDKSNRAVPPCLCLIICDLRIDRLRSNHPLPSTRASKRKPTTSGLRRSVPPRQQRELKSSSPALPDPACREDPLKIAFRASFGSSNAQSSIRDRRPLAP